MAASRAWVRLRRQAAAKSENVIQGTDEPTGRLDAPILLVTKLHPPSVPAQTVARERLFERLRDGRELKLSLVACPAGFGKSTLLAAWRERESLDRPVAWLTLDEGDSPEAIRAHAEASGLSVDEIVPVADTVVVRPDPVPAQA